MPYSLPIVGPGNGSSQAAGTIETNLALIAGTASVVVLPALGTGLRYRCIGGQWGINRLAAAVNADIFIRDTVSGLNIASLRGLSLAGVPSGPLIIPEPGLTLGDNSALTLIAISSAAAGSAFLILYFYIDALN